MYNVGAPGFSETVFAATTEMAIWLMFWKVVQSGECGPVSIVYIYIYII